MSAGVRIRKKPVTITAERYGHRETGQWHDACLALLVAFVKDKDVSDLTHDDSDDILRPVSYYDPDDGKYDLEVYDRLHDTWVKVFLGQWVLRGVEGELYPCDHDVLLRTYDFVE